MTRARTISLGVGAAAALLAQAGLAEWPPAPAVAQVPAKAWLLMDYDSGRVLAEHGADQVTAPASLTKLMTAYLLFEKLKRGEFRLDDTVHVSARAWGAKGARLFVRPETSARAEELLMGMLVRSANDATVALVEHAAGSEAAFVAQMNATARALGLEQTAFVNATGLDEDGQRSSARDMTRLAAALARDFPEQYPRFSVKEFTYNQIKQYNRNALLWRDAAVDGVKTGQTRAAGYCLIASARRDNMRLIATVMGAADENGRIEAAQRLLEYGFRHFETRLLYRADTPAARVRVWMGEASLLPIGVAQNLYLTLPRGWHEKLRARLTLGDGPTAPIRLGQNLGTLVLDLEERRFAEYPLVALKEVGLGNLFQRALDQIQLWLQ